MISQFPGKLDVSKPLINTPCEFGVGFKNSTVMGLAKVVEPWAEVHTEQ